MTAIKNAFPTWGNKEHETRFIKLTPKQISNTFMLF